MRENVLITTGGSGGHVIPAMILYDHLSNYTDVTISTDKRGTRFLNKDIYNYSLIDTPRLKNILFLPINLILILYLTLKSYFLLKNKKIGKLICTGGYMSLPVILAAKMLNLKIYLLEPNMVLGRANKFFLKSCRKIFCYTEQVKNFPENLKRKMVIIKPLVRENIYKLNQSSNKRDKINILIIGGSQGASIFDKNLKNSIVNISKKFPLNIIHQTNYKNITQLKDFYYKHKVENIIFIFDKNFDNIIKKTDLCSPRAGASTLAELSVLNIPFIAVPLPNSIDNHQFENANFYKSYDCCWIIEQNFFEEKIEEVLNEILIDKSDYLKKKENLKKLNYQNTWNNVNQKILKTINEN